MASTTVAQYYTKVARKFGMTPTTDEKTAILECLNEAYEDVILYTGANVREADPTLTSGTNDYELDSDILRILDMSAADGTDTVPMIEVTLPEMSELRRTSSVATPARYFAMTGPNRFSVYPTPGAGESINMIYVARPVALAAVTDVPTSIPSEFHKLLEWYALAEMAEVDNHGPSQFGTYYRGLYEAGKRAMKTHIRRKGSTMIPGAVVGMSRRQSLRLPMTQSDPSRIDW